MNVMHGPYVLASSYRAGDDTDILGILFEPVVHVLTHSKQVVKAGSLSWRPVTLWHLGQQEKGEMDVSNGTAAAEQQFTCHEESADRDTTTSQSRGAILAKVTPHLHLAFLDASAKGWQCFILRDPCRSLEEMHFVLWIVIQTAQLG